MLIDATDPEETRVVVLSSSRLEEFDYESTSRKQLKGNIYLAKVTRVEPSLQAAFVEYGGNRHGFLPFSEIHPDYYRIPIADREALIAEQEAEEDDEPESSADLASQEAPQAAEAEPGESLSEEASDQAESGSSVDDGAPALASEEAGAGKDHAQDEPEEIETESQVDTVGGDEADEQARRRAISRRHYKIQEVIKRRQVLLVQVTKEERGNKGAALTTYLSLAGRYCVLMPNTNKGGGISRKIASATDRKRLKQIVSELSIPQGMAIIVRTAGSERSKAEIRRDAEYLLRLWEDIRNETLASRAPSLIYEEASLIKRSIRDLYTRDMDEILVAGEEGYKNAKAFMKSLMPSHARKVQLFKNDNQPIFQQYKVERQLDEMYSNTVQLRSGGYIVMNSTEALVAIDVNSGKATRERHIEETALKTNLEAATEVARQLRLRDLAGLIVIDFIDMEESRHNREVERRLKEAMRLDRARIQLGRISPFGLLELSRQRLRPSLFESSTQPCQHCEGRGYIRTTESSALHVLRVLEEEGQKRRGGEVVLTVPTPVALFILNQRRERLLEIEQRYDLEIEIQAGDELGVPGYDLLHHGGESTGRSERDSREARRDEEDEDDSRRGRRRRRGGRRRDEEESRDQRHAAEDSRDEEEDEEDSGEAEEPRQARDRDREHDGEEDGDRPRSRRRRGKRGGRRRSRRREQEGERLASDDERFDSERSGADSSDDEAERYESDERSYEDQHEEAGEEPREAEASEDEGEDRPRRGRGRRGGRGRGRRRDAAAEESAGEETAGEPREDESEAREAGSAEADSEEDSEDRPKRRRGRRGGRGRSKKTREAAESQDEERLQDQEAAPEAQEPLAEPESEPQPEPEPQSEPEPEPAREWQPEPAQASNGNGQLHEEAAAGDSQESEEARSADSPEAEEESGEEKQPDQAPPQDESDQPKRKGWWSRFM